MDDEMRKIFEQMAAEPQVDRILSMVLVLFGEALTLLLNSGDLARVQAFRRNVNQIFDEAGRAVAQRRGTMN